MAQEKEPNAPIIIIKRVKKGGHEAHHGGAWKVAYADFVTAMMAFFLLLWLLQATTEEQKLGIADYFAPASVARSKSGADGILGGRTFTKKGVKPNDRTPIGVVIELPTNPPDWDNQGEGKDQNEFGEAKSGDDSEASEPSQSQAQSSEQPDQNQLEEFLAAREEEQFAEAEAALRQAIDSVPELKELANNLIIDQISEGMRIQIVDEAGESMFARGSANMYGHTKQLMALIVGAVQQLPQQIAIKGHTDSTPYVGATGYSNWELSTDRANSSRRALVEGGLNPERISSVVGRADQEHLDEDNPNSPRNRRISIILLRESAVTGPSTAKAPGGDSAGTAN